MWHHTEMATVLRADTCDVIVRAIRVSGIACVVVLRNHVVSALGFGEMELTLSVSHPQTEFVTAQRAEHHAVVLRNVEADELALELMRIIMQHLGALRTSETELDHQLTTVTDTE